jgi:hypothetical protein
MPNICTVLALNLSLGTLVFSLQLIFNDLVVNDKYFWRKHISQGL